MATPELSVVIAAWNGPASLRRCLASLEGQVDGNVEVIVVRNFAAGPTAFAGVVDVPMPAGTPVPLLRGAGLARSHAPVIAFLEDHAACAAGWAAAVQRAHRADVAAVGGPVEQGDGATRLDWAAYFADYGRYMPPCAAGPADDLSGLNVAYKRALLERLKPQLAGGLFEAEIHAELRRLALTMYLEPEALVIHHKRYRVGAALGHSFHLARGYAAGRVTGTGAAQRLFRAGTALLLPAVLAARIAHTVCRKRRNCGALATSAPWLVLILIFWAAGEGVGYLTGAGASAQKWH